MPSISWIKHISSRLLLRFPLSQTEGSDDSPSMPQTCFSCLSPITQPQATENKPGTSRVPMCRSVICGMGFLIPKTFYIQSQGTHHAKQDLSKQRRCKLITTASNREKSKMSRVVWVGGCCTKKPKRIISIFLLNPIARQKPCKETLNGLKDH